ncbi:hypothetical protein GIB67_021473 [Kingdonia uniflora]|uniref:DUF4283 domain-containing protein n=1 Tax=Kingdonia uniflora TaxID=39325 RepID=A0A7J7L9I2_9MAGN|nr:hypothetical protein GIB67_021473 [Kingdonia uniflora]
MAAGHGSHHPPVLRPPPVSHLQPRTPPLLQQTSPSSEKFPYALNALALIAAAPTKFSSSFSQPSSPLPCPSSLKTKKTIRDLSLLELHEIISQSDNTQKDTRSSDELVVLKILYDKKISSLDEKERVLFLEFVSKPKQQPGRVKRRHSTFKDQQQALRDQALVGTDADEIEIEFNGEGGSQGVDANVVDNAEDYGIGGSKGVVNGDESSGPELYGSGLRDNIYGEVVGGVTHGSDEDTVHKAHVPGDSRENTPHYTAHNDLTDCSANLFSESGLEEALELSANKALSTIEPSSNDPQPSLDPPETQQKSDHAISNQNSNGASSPKTGDGNTSKNNGEDISNEKNKDGISKSKQFDASSSNTASNQSSQNTSGNNTGNPKGGAASSLTLNPSLESIPNDFPPLSTGSRSLPFVPSLNWAQLLGNAPKVRGKSKLCYTPPVLVEGALRAKIKSADFEDKIRECETYVVGYFVGKRFDFNFVKEVVSKAWGTKADFEMQLQNNNLFLFKFTNDEDREKVLELGSQHIANRLFVIRPWCLNIEKEITNLRIIPIWVILRKIPNYLWNPEGIGLIASVIGVPICLDRATEEKTRLNYARVCVEINYESELPYIVPFDVDDGEVAHIEAEYAWLPPKCLDCGVFGHSTLKCEARVSGGTEPTHKTGFVQKVWKPVEGKGAKAKLSSEVDGWSVPKTKKTTKNVAMPCCNGTELAVSNGTFDCLNDDSIEEAGVTTTPATTQATVDSSKDNQGSGKDEGEQITAGEVKTSGISKPTNRTNKSKGGGVVTQGRTTTSNNGVNKKGSKPTQQQHQNQSGDRHSVANIAGGGKSGTNNVTMQANQHLQYPARALPNHSASNRVRNNESVREIALKHAQMEQKRREKERTAEVAAQPGTNPNFV